MTVIQEAARIASAEEARYQEQYEYENMDMIAEFESFLDQRDRTRTCTHCDGTGVKELRMSGRLHDVTAVKCPRCRG
jgi:DnaJ-class molecular chaperone